ncbi:MAG: GNAT family N-acetyltransferase [Ectothiorhodospiraceae bacterium]|nr:GNAT family N-acetyltransferase [Ectothiorhodospiraceae bacterium]MCH8502947.1 GNAT family N-acetyltransferase [Ectothiorhodospiraceae bacterium]
MRETITLRSAQAGESGLLSELACRSKAYWGYSREFMEACRKELSESESGLFGPSRYCTVAEFNGTVVGYYALQSLAPDECELEALFVEPRHIGQGIGRALIEHAKSRARRNGARFMVIQADPNAVKFYLAAGGVQVGERESGSIPGRYLPEFEIVLGAEKTA